MRHDEARRHSRDSDSEANPESNFERTHLLLSTLVASPLDARLPLLLVVLCGTVTVTIVIAIDAARAVAHHGYGAPLPLGGAIRAETGSGAGAVGKDLAADGDGAGRAERGGRSTILGMGLAVSCRGWAGSGEGGAVHAR